MMSKINDTQIQNYRKKSSSSSSSLPFYIHCISARHGLDVPKQIILSDHCFGFKLGMDHTFGENPLSRFNYHSGVSVFVCLCAWFVLVHVFACVVFVYVFLQFCARCVRACVFECVYVYVFHLFVTSYKGDIEFIQYHSKYIKVQHFIQYRPNSCNNMLYRLYVIRKLTNAEVTWKVCRKA